MDSDEFRKYGKEMVDLVADYWDSLKVDATINSDTTPSSTHHQTNEMSKLQRKPLSNVKPGYIWDVIPKEAPSQPESWKQIFADIEPIVLNANTHWHHPNFFAYYPTSCSYAALIGDILSGGISSIGFTWNSSPSMTELEMAMTDWLARAIGLPAQFLNSDPGNGCGIIQSTASDATFVALLSARARAVDRIKTAAKLGNESGLLDPNWIQSTLNKAMDKINIKSIVSQKLLSSKMFTNEVGNKAKEKTVEVAGVEQRLEKVVSIEEEDGAYGFRNHDPVLFQKFIAYCSDQKDKERGFIPFALIATIGTTNTCGCDQLDVLGPICAKESIWLHADAAYAGSFLLCDEFRYMSKGVEYVDSFNFNAHKAMMINFDCSPMWFKNATEAIEYFKIDPLYLKHAHQMNASDYRHLQIALGRRFRALKIWFVLRAIGIARIQEHLRKQVKLAEQFAMLIQGNSMFELFVPQTLGLVCFRLKRETGINEKLTEAINLDGRIHLVPASVHGTYFLRFAICSENTNEKHIQNAYDVIVEIAEKLSRNFN